MSTATTSKPATTSSNAAARPGTAPATGPRPASASPTASQSKPDPTVGLRPGPTKPWTDLPPNVSLGMKEPRDKSVPATVLACVRQDGGATLEEIKEALKQMSPPMGHHDPGQAIRWQNANRGFGFKMNKETGKIKLVTK